MNFLIFKQYYLNHRLFYKFYFFHILSFFRFESLVLSFQLDDNKVSEIEKYTLLLENMAFILPKVGSVITSYNRDGSLFRKYILKTEGLSSKFIYNYISLHFFFTRPYLSEPKINNLIYFLNNAYSFSILLTRFDKFFFVSYDVQNWVETLKITLNSYIKNPLILKFLLLLHIFVD